MSCIWNVKPTERHCGYYVVENCNERLPKQPQTITSTQSTFEQVDWPMIQ